MTAGLVVVGLVIQEGPEEMSLAERDDVISTLATARANDAFCVRILPGRLPGADHLFDPHRFDFLPEHSSVDRTTVTMEVSRHLAVTWEGLDDLLGCPFGMSGDESAQMDVIVTNNKTPKFSLGAKRFASVNGCVVVATIKSTLDSNELRDALKNLESLPDKRPLGDRAMPQSSVQRAGLRRLADQDRLWLRRCCDGCNPRSNTQRLLRGE